MPFKTTHTYSLGSLTGSVPFANVIRSMIETLNDENARIGAFKDTVFLDGRSSPDAIFEFIQNITSAAERWSQKRIDYLDAVPGSMGHKDRRLFDHELIRDMSRSMTYSDTICVLDRCGNERNETPMIEQEDAVTFERTTLRMDHIPTLMTSEILYEELMLNTKDFNPLYAPALQDRSDVETIHCSSLDYPANAELLHDADRLLLNVIAQSVPLRRVFVVQKASAAEGWAWRESAISTFETHVQESLQWPCVLIHISSGQPLREPELFSILWRNMQRRHHITLRHITLRHITLRHITLRHERVMVHTEYSKQQQQQGLYQNSVRFLAQPVGTLLLDYLAFVRPLRELFLRKSSRQTPIPPFLWEKDGKLHISNWRQIPVAIVKTKFAADALCFDLEDASDDGEKIEADIKIMTPRNCGKRSEESTSSSSTESGEQPGLPLRTW
ncbi:hypothetical protein LTR49_027914 [Elasticomyces elasticus]|nr:hypothetical protein LTR49_027914 [Elasticomyces elasticus]KAK5734947.1 hypothetical protein LTS12_026591 [Elasticomyces elasticus]